MQTCIPACFGYSYIVPKTKSKDSVNKAVTYDDFRGIAISPILSKGFEYCFIHKFGKYLYTDEKQFGFKKEFAAPMPYIVPFIKLWNL